MSYAKPNGTPMEKSVNDWTLRVAAEITEDGPLGLHFVADEQDLVVLEIEPGCAAVRACPELRVGMVLVAVGEIEVGGAGNKDTLQLVAVGARPLRLTFRPPERRTREY